ncbi:MAG: hypothetical protein OEY14_13170 [Myxococcales bacterium]|nr:hypothetical protein [Myxococcales bacterium]
MIDELPPRYREVLRRVEVESKTQKEVAGELGLSLSGAKSRVQRGRAELARRLQLLRGRDGSPGQRSRHRAPRALPLLAPEEDQGSGGSARGLSLDYTPERL